MTYCTVLRVGVVLTLGVAGTRAAADAACKDRSFGPGTVFDAGPVPSMEQPTPHVLLTEDFNGDGKLDFASLNRGPSQVGILLGNGDGTFSPAQSYTIMTHQDSLPEGLCAGDFDGDGYMDLAAVDLKQSRLIVLMNDGSADFSDRTEYVLPSDAEPHGVMAVDLDLDTDLDIITSSQKIGGLTVFMNNGPGDNVGTFQLWKTFDSGSYTQFAAAGDFDGDGDPDVVGANAGFGELPDATVFKNSGDGTLIETARLAVPIDSMPISAFTADLDNDGKLDIVIGSWFFNPLCIFWGDGAGNFSDALIYYTPGASAQPAAADFDGDGWLDIAVATVEEPVVYLLWNERNRTFSPGPALPTGGEPRYPAAGDFDRDGDLDLASAQKVAGKIKVFENLACHDKPFRRGDPNADGRVNIADAVSILEYLFLSGDTPSCASSADTNDDTRINVADAVAILEHLFIGGPTPPLPFPECGPDPTEDLGCARYQPCAVR